MNLPISPIPGVPDELVTAINDRFRRVGSGTETAVVKVALRGGSGSVPIPAGPSGPASNLILAEVGFATYWVIDGNEMAGGFTITVTPTLRAGVDWTALALIQIVMTGPGTDTTSVPIGSMVGPFTVGTGVVLKTDRIFITNPSLGAQTYHLKFVCLNGDNIPAAGTALTVDQTLTPPTVTATAVETGPRTRTDSGASATSVTVTPTLSFNPGGATGKMPVTIWETHDWGGTIGVRTTWKGWYPCVGVSSAILLTGDNLVYVTQLPASSTALQRTVTVRVAVGTVDKELSIPASAATATFVMAAPASSASWVTGAAIGPTTYGNGTWKLGQITYTADFTAHAEMKSTRVSRIVGNYSGGVFTPTVGWPETSFADVDLFSTDTKAPAYIVGSAVTVNMLDYWQMPTPIQPNSVKIVISIDNASEIWTAQTCWPASGGTASVHYVSDGAIIVPDAVLGALSAPITPAQIGDGVYLDGLGRIKVGTANDPGNMLANGSFEDGVLGGTPSGWTIGGGQVGTVAQANNPAPSGFNTSLKCVALNGSHSSVVQTFQCRPGAGFFLEDWVYAAGAGGTMRCGLIWLTADQQFNGIVEAPQFSAPGMWKRMYVSGFAPTIGTTGQATAYVQAFLCTNNGAGNWYVDNASLRGMITGPQVQTSNGLGFDVNGNLIVSANAEFKFVGGQLVMNGVDFSKGFNGFQVGPATIPKITITTAGGVNLGWIGSDTGVGGSGYEGAWFKRVTIGGTSPANAPFVADAGGNVSIQGSLIVGHIVSADIAVQKIVAWNLANIIIDSGVTFQGSNFAVRLNQVNVNGQPAAIDSNGPICATDFVANLNDGNTYRGVTAVCVWPVSFSYQGFPGKTTMTFKRGLLTSVT